MNPCNEDPIWLSEPVPGLHPRTPSRCLGPGYDENHFWTYSCRRGLHGWMDLGHCHQRLHNHLPRLNEQRQSLRRHLSHQDGMRWSRQIYFGLQTPHLYGRLQHWWRNGLWLILPRTSCRTPGIHDPIQRNRLIYSLQWLGWGNHKTT